MTKTYLRGFVTYKYVVLLPAAFAFSIVLMLAYVKTRNNLLHTLSLAGVALLIVLVLWYYHDRNSIGRKLRKIPNWKAYDDSWIIGQAFLLDARMLVYDRRIHEFHYADLKAVTAEQGKKETWKLTFQSDQDAAYDITSSKAQAERFLAFLKQKNPAIKINGLEPCGDGLIQHIESGKDAPRIG